MADVYFITGIDTDAGKSWCTGWLARHMAETEGRRVVTVKFIQTGNKGFSEDINVHRHIMGTGLLDVDLAGITAPMLFDYPASPQLAAAMQGETIDVGRVDRAVEQLSRQFDTILIEGAGGMMVPLTDDYMIIDYAMDRRLPVIPVTNSVLGSINHTVLTLEALVHRGVQIPVVLYNTYFDHDPRIASDTYRYISMYLGRELPSTRLVRVPTLTYAP